MKKVLIAILCLVILVIPVMVAFLFNDTKTIDKMIKQTNDYISEREIDDKLFSNILQSKLNKSLTYSIGDNETLIVYKDKYYSYKNKLLKKEDESNFKLENNIENALDNDIDTRILTKGYYKEFDGGNGYFIVEKYNENDNELIISNKEKNKSLRYICFNSTINIYQLGYKDEYIDTYVNHFTKDLKYQNIYLPKKSI